MPLLGLFRNKSEPVCQEHLQIALDGVYPGLSTFNMALNGFGCSIDVIITPVEPEQNGGGSIPWDWEVNPPKYTVKFVITLKSGKVMTSEHQYTHLGVQTLEGVIAKLKSVAKIIDHIGIKINLVSSWISKVIVKARGLK